LSEFLEFVREAKGSIKNSLKIITTAFGGEFPTKGQKVWDYSNWDIFVQISCVSNNCHLPTILCALIALEYSLMLALYAKSFVEMQ
jgi:hypothetical protein